MNAGSIILLGSEFGKADGGGASTLGPPYPTRMRSPLPPYPEPIDYKTVLPFTRPTGRVLDFYRGQFCAIRVPGAPAVPGGNDKNPTAVMSCLLDNYPPRVQDQFLDLYASDGYTHLQRSLGHALHYNNQNLDAYIALSQRARSVFGLYCDHWFLAGQDVWGHDCKDQSASWWQQKLDPHIPRLLDAGVIDLACVGWQLDGYNIPGNSLLAIIKYIAEALPRSIPLWTHWMNEALAWWATNIDPATGENLGEVWTDEYQTIRVHDRFTWWAACQPYLSGGHHQGNTRMLIKEYQDRLCDTLDYFGGDTGKGNMGQSQRSPEGPQPFAMTVFECSGQDQFDDQPGNPHAISEDEGDLRGYLLMCTTSQWAHLSGFGNGARMPDGSVF